MTKTCTNKNPLTRGGTSQKQRLLDAIRKDYVHIDEHTTSDLLVFARQFAGRLKYYDIDQKISGDWGDFFASDVSILIAIIAENNVSAYEQGFEQILDALSAEIAALYDPPTTVGGVLQIANLEDLPEYLPSLKKVFDYILSLAQHLDQQITKLPEATGLKAFARSVIQQHCRTPFKKLLGIYKVGSQDPLIAGNDYLLIDETHRKAFPAVREIQQFYTQDIIQKGLSEIWLDTTLSWSDFYNALNYLDFQEAFGNPPSPITTPENVEQLVMPVVIPLSGIFENLIKAINQIVFEAPRFLEETLNDWPQHQPHLALYLAFLKLYRFAQSHLNGLKERHVSYYYKEVLRLKEKGATPDEVHLILQLAKHVEDYLLEDGTTFKAGKDGEGNEVIYEALEATALNKAQVAQIKSIYHTIFDGKIYAAPIANSEDGLGTELTNPDGQWHPFGPSTQFTGDVTQAHPEIPLPPPLSDTDASNLFEQVTQVAEVGFAIASPNLYLREGQRTIILTLTAALIDPTGDPVITTNWAVDHFKILLTSEEGWIEKALTDLPTYNGTELSIEIKLSADDAPVLPYNPLVHFETFQTNAPIVKVLLREANGTSIYNELRKLDVTNVHTRVEVTGVKDLVVQNQTGRLDLSKPITPFGSSPKIGSAFILGNNEVFQKILIEDLTLHFEWDGLNPVGNIFKPGFDVTASLEYLKNNDWQDGPAGIDLIEKTLTTLEEEISVAAVEGLANFGRTDYAKFEYGPNKSYAVKSKDGFLRCSLDRDFGHQDFLREYPKALIRFSTDPDDTSGIDGRFTTTACGDGPPFAIVIGTDGEPEKCVVLRDPPYTPTFKEMSLDYIAQSTFNFSDTEEEALSQLQGQFFHVHPFGQRLQHPLLNISNANIALMPQYNYEGNLYIGLSDIFPQQSVSILFQVAEGSANPLAEKQIVEWFYLYNNNWVKFNEADYADSTNGLLQSGIIQFFLPRKINNDNTWLESGHIWLRASVGTSSDAISKIISIEAQAVKASFSDQDNAEDFLATPLAAGTIKKLLQSDASIKKINQPYDSFGGKVKEKSEHFFKRVSERLRHKDRAIAIWDYEHLVLEAFPEIYKVKCLNHTQLRTDPDDSNHKFINEIAPGYVLFVAIPDLKNRNAVDPLKPYTSLNTLDLIKQYLQKRISPHVNLDVVNPLFEAIKLDFQVQFHQGKDFTIYKKILEQEIIAFLSPWAFESEEKKDIEFGGSICKSVLLDFVEERPYVDFVTEFRMDQLTGPDLPDILDIEEAIASTARSILVSNGQHIINELANNCI